MCKQQIDFWWRIGIHLSCMCARHSIYVPWPFVECELSQYSTCFSGFFLLGLFSYFHLFSLLCGKWLNGSGFFSDGFFCLCIHASENVDDIKNRFQFTLSKRKVKKNASKWTELKRRCECEKIDKPKATNKFSCIWCEFVLSTMKVNYHYWLLWVCICAFV